MSGSTLPPARSIRSKSDTVQQQGQTQRGARTTAAAARHKRRHERTSGEAGRWPTRGYARRRRAGSRRWPRAANSAAAGRVGTMLRSGCVLACVAGAAGFSIPLHQLRVKVRRAKLVQVSAAELNRAPCLACRSAARPNNSRAPTRMCTMSTWRLAHLRSRSGLSSTRVRHALRAS